MNDKSIQTSSGAEPEHETSFVKGSDPQGTPKENKITLDNRISITGIVNFDGDLHLDGHFDSDFSCERLFIGEAASVDGVVTAGMVEILGEMHGEIYANLVILRPTAYVEAELYYRALELDPGCHFEGRFRRLQDPLAISPAFQPVTSDD